MTEDEVVILLRKEIMLIGSQREWGRQFGVSKAYVSLILNGNARPGPKVLAALSLKKVIRYIPTQNPPK